MQKICIPKEEFQQRIDKIKEYMTKEQLDVILVYGDEYRKENLRYVSNYWPIFERGALLITTEGEPIVLCAPEGEQVAREMSVWPDVRLVPDFLCVTVPDEIEYPLAKFTSFKSLAAELRSRTGLCRLGIAGMDAMSEALLHNIRAVSYTHLLAFTKVGAGCCKGNPGWAGRR